MAKTQIVSGLALSALCVSPGNGEIVNAINDVLYKAQADN
jgi:hypothetical protein